MKLIRWAAVVVGLTLVSVVRADSTIVTFESAGGNAAAIMATRDAFGVAIGGGAVAGANGSFGGVRRKINWDGVPDAQADPNSFSANFFNVISPPGVVFGTPGSGFLASANAGQSASVLFGFANDFQVFSPQRPFTAVNSNVTHVRLFVPDTAMATTTTASGLAFVDVEVAGSTRLQFFDANNVQMYSPDALVAGNHGLTVLGGVDSAAIARVRITSGANTIVDNGVLGDPTTTSS